MLAVLGAVACSAADEPGGRGAGGGSGAVQAGTAAMQFGNTDMNGSGGAGLPGTGGADGVGGTGSASGGATGMDGTAGVCGGVTGEAPAAQDICGNGLDDDHNGFVDEFCPCTLGQTQECFGGRPDQLSSGTCSMGTQLCDGPVEFAAWGPCEGWDCGTPVEQCDGAQDEDCDGQVDEGCELDVPVELDGDCLIAACPAQAPFPVGCEIQMEGGDDRGCVANTPGQPDVYFQEGDACGAGRVVGRLLCSTQMPTVPLDENSCSINKPQPTFGLSRNDCAPTGCVEVIPGVCI